MIKNDVPEILRSVQEGYEYEPDIIRSIQEGYDDNGVKVTPKPETDATVGDEPKKKKKTALGTVFMTIGWIGLIVPVLLLSLFGSSLADGLIDGINGLKYR